jgi:hypothetical protein
MHPALAGVKTAMTVTSDVASSANGATRPTDSWALVWATRQSAHDSSPMETDAAEQNPA